MTQFIKDLRGKVTIGVVGGSDTVKIQEQLGPDCACPAAAPGCRARDSHARRQRRVCPRPPLPLPREAHAAAANLSQASTRTTGSSRRTAWPRTRSGSSPPPRSLSAASPHRRRRNADTHDALLCYRLAR